MTGPEQAHDPVAVGVPLIVTTCPDIETLMAVVIAAVPLLVENAVTLLDAGPVISVTVLPVY